MIHYDYQEKTWASLESGYPHTPIDDRQSFIDYLEDQLVNGLELVSFTGANPMQFVFRVIAK